MKVVLHIENRENDKYEGTLVQPVVAVNKDLQYIKDHTNFNPMYCIVVNVPPNAEKTYEKLSRKQLPGRLYYNLETQSFCLGSQFRAT